MKLYIYKRLATLKFILILKKPCINNERAGKSPNSFSCIDNKVVSVADSTKQNKKSYLQLRKLMEKSWRFPLFSFF
jgi:hypothetical protein